MTSDDLRALLRDLNGGPAVLATLQPDGRPHLSTVTYTYSPERDDVRVSIRDGLVKTRNLRRDPRVTLQVSRPDASAWVSVVGTGRLTDVAADPDDATVDELVDLYRSARGEHPDWQDYREAMVRDDRIALTVPVERVYGFIR